MRSLAHAQQVRGRRFTRRVLSTVQYAAVAAQPLPLPLRLASHSCLSLLTSQLVCWL
jgi:hypothetical protein